MFPTGIHLTAAPDDCDVPTARVDITAKPYGAMMPILLHSLKYFGPDQFLHDRADLWACFKEGIHFAAGGSLSSVPSMIGKSPAQTETCGVHYLFRNEPLTYNFLHQLMVRVKTAPPPAMQMSWPSCQLFYEANKFYTGGAINFNSSDPSEEALKGFRNQGIVGT